jgi:hypothetical protein
LSFSIIVMFEMFSVQSGYKSFTVWF